MIDLDNVTISAPRSRDTERYIDVTITDNTGGATGVVSAAGESFDFTSAPTDSVEYGVEIYKRALAGVYGEVSMCPGDGSIYTWEGAGWVLTKTNIELVREANEYKKNELLALAADAIAPLQDAVDLGMVTDGEKKSLTEWKTYRVLLNRLDVSNSLIEWPTPPRI